MSELTKLSNTYFNEKRGKDNYVNGKFHVFSCGGHRTVKRFKFPEKYDTDMITLVNYLKKYHYADDIWGRRGQVSQYFTLGINSQELYSIINAGIERDLLPKNMQVINVTPVPIFTQFGFYNSKNLDLTHYPSIE